MDSGGLNITLSHALTGDEGLLDTLKELIINHKDYSVEYKNYYKFLTKLPKFFLC